jgi:hypothetical protein
MKSLKRKLNTKTRRNNKRIKPKSNKNKSRKMKNKIKGGYEPETNNKNTENTENIKNTEKNEKNENTESTSIYTGIRNQLSGFIEDPRFLEYLKINNIFDKFSKIETPKKKVKIVFYASQGKKNSPKKYPNFKVFIDNGNSIYSSISQVDNMLGSMVDPNIMKRSDLFKRSIDIDIEDLSKIVDLQKANEKKQNNERQRK